MYIGAIEAGGTKMCCCVADEAGNIIEECTIPTGEPSTTFDDMAAFFIDFCDKNSARLAALGMGWFGPIDVRRDSCDYGKIGSTPKPGWAGINVVTEIKNRINKICDKYAVTTDVNSSLLGECWLGQGVGLSDVCYITVGTGIGAGIMLDGKLIGGFSHPEFGHINVGRVSGDDFEGVCPYHKCCFEGMASGPAMQQRWGVPAFELPADHAAWDYEADYIASAVVNLILTVCPTRVILGGGVMQHAGLLDRIRVKAAEKMAKYMDTSAVGDMEGIIVAESLGGRQGVLGCVKLGLDT